MRICRMGRWVLTMASVSLLFCAGCEEEDKTAKPADISGVWSGLSKSKTSTAEITLTLQQNGSAITGTEYVKGKGSIVGIVGSPVTRRINGTYSTDSGILEITYTESNSGAHHVSRYEFEDDNTMVLIYETSGGYSTGEKDEVLSRQ